MLAPTTFAKNFGFLGGIIFQYLRLKMRLQQTATFYCNKLATNRDVIIQIITIKK